MVDKFFATVFALNVNMCIILKRAESVTYLPYTDYPTSNEVPRNIKLFCYIASAKTKRDWLIPGHVTLDKCNVSLGQSLGQQVSNCCPLGPAAYINKQNGGESCKFVNSDFRAFCLKKYTIDREDTLLKLKFNYSSKF